MGGARSGWSAQVFGGALGEGGAGGTPAPQVSGDVVIPAGDACRRWGWYGVRGHAAEGSRLRATEYTPT